MLGIAAFRRELQVMDTPCEVGTQRAVRLHDTLRLTRRTGSINHIGQMVGSRLIDRLRCGLLPVFNKQHVVYCKVTLLAFCIIELLGGDQHAGLRILQHIEQTIIGIFVVHRHVGTTGFLHGQHREEELLAARHHDTHEGIGGDALFTQLGSQRVRPFVKLLIGIAACGIHHSCGVRLLAGMTHNHINEGLVGIIGQFLTLRQLHELLFLFIADNAHGRQRLIGLCHHRVDASLDSARHLGQELQVVELLTGLYADVVLSVHLIDDCRQLCTGVTLRQIVQRSLIVAEVQVFGNVSTLIAEGDTLSHLQVAAEVREWIYSVADGAHQLGTERTHEVDDRLCRFDDGFGGYQTYIHTVGLTQALVHTTVVQ